jgi:tetratricopeptide (TPR) repeat protein
MPANVNALLGLGDIALQQGKPAEALRQYQEALRQQPEYARALPDATHGALILIHLRLALTYERLGQVEEAGQALAAARQLAQTTAAALPTHPQARFYLGVVYWVAGESGLADDAFAEAARCDVTLAAERARMVRRIEHLRE